MSYYIDIIDTVSPLDRIVPELASGGGIVLKWNGGDAKEALAIVTSEFNFDMLDRTHQDAAFKAYYTGNETRFKVQLRLNSDDSILWQGFILPDLYSEPYKNGNLFVNFTATDGLGRLKGKYLSSEYYSREKSLIAIYCQILRMTGLELDLYFAPAIENFLVKSWNSIFIDTAVFLEKDKKIDAYKILEMLLKDTLCVCYQCDNRWYIEGINMRHQRKITYKAFDFMGNAIGTIVYDRLVKQITPLVEPLVTIIPPYNEIVVSTEKIAPGLAKTVSRSGNGGWAVVTGVIGEVYPNDWMSFDGVYHGRCVAPNYETVVFAESYFNGAHTVNWPQDDTKYISLKEKLYFANKDKVSIALTFDIVHPETGNKGDVEKWNNVIKYQILFNGVVLFSNFNNGGSDVVEDREKLLFSTGGNCKITIDHVFAAEGLLDIRLFRPVGRVSENGVLGVKLSAAEISIIDFKEEVSVTDLINDDFTVDAEVPLEFSDDKTGASKAFRLVKLKEDTSTYNLIQVYILHGLVFEGKNYSMVQLDGAKLIKDNPYTVYKDGNQIAILDVVYNFVGDGRMAIETLDLHTSGSFYVRKYGVNDIVSSRNHWVQWTDAFYKIENNSYMQTVANIYRRMFNKAHEKIELTAKNAVKFNDIIPFKYEFLKDFHVLSCTWNLDNNHSSLVLGRSIYKEFSTENPNESNIPPIVEAGDTIYIADGVTTASLLATAYDPDGEVVSQVWTQIAGEPAATMSSPTALANNLSGLTANDYTFQIQVTDNDGATSLDTVRVIREKDYVISLELVEDVFKDRSPRLFRQKFKIVVTPELPSNYVINLKGLIHLFAGASVNPNLVKIPATAWYNIYLNGVFFGGQTIISSDYREVKEETIPVVLSYIANDKIYITIYIEKDRGSNRFDMLNRFKALANLKIQTATIASGFGAITGLPIERQLLMVNDD